ncbi:sigma-54-dependent transcriptional regulator [Desulfovibrio inopinatus]|uniref:sigma-54-dependent transcriptional regulator n=1 Tax=Desulfovibrio inopinatus TaxID=102109 RepID=UPI0003F90ED3|nr:sigma-54 dependent transcriptional regulator [Desulfovibrio inopinatus]
MTRILLIDDDPLFAASLRRQLSGLGYTVEHAETLQAGFHIAQAGFDIIFLDVGLPDGSGLDAVEALRSPVNAPEIIIMTGKGDPDGAALAISSGVWDYLEKPFSLDKMRLCLTRALEYRTQHRSQPDRPRERHGIVGNAPALLACLDRLAEAGWSDAPVLLFGETGTGKELFAHALHRISSRSSLPFVVVDCAAIPDNLLESELFGHTRGAFTGASVSRTGLVGLADKGTLFLDEIGELPLSGQKTFLRVLQEKRYRPLGGQTEVNSNFRLIAATNQRLETMVRSGHFRRDLLYRLAGVVIELPCLRDRMEDIPELVRHRLAEHARQRRATVKQVAADLFDTLSVHSWPGNVRELFAVVDQAVLRATNEPTLFARHLPDWLRTKAIRARLTQQPAPQNLDAPDPIKVYRDAMDKAYLMRLMQHTGHNVSRAAEIAGLSRQRLHVLLKYHDL